MFWTSLDRYRDAGLLVARAGFGFGFVWFHGMPKLLGGAKGWAGYGTAMENFGVTFASEWWGLAAAFGETFGGLLLAFGWFFRPASLALMAVMIVAATNHIVSGQGTAAHAFKNAWLFAGFFLMGPGRYSIDQYFTRGARQRA